MKLSFYPYQLKFKHPFSIAHGTRSTTDVVYVKLQHEGFIAWGEAALPPYLTETQKSVIEFLEAFGKSFFCITLLCAPKSNPSFSTFRKSR